MASRRRTRLQASLALGVFALLGLELALRLQTGAGTSALDLLVREAHEPAAPRLIPHPQRIYTLAPEQRATPGHAGRYANGSWPFRGRPPCPAPDEARRIVLLGESCVFGSGLDPSQTLSERTAEHLDRLGHARELCQVLNFGVPGYTIVQVQALLEEVLPDLHPACVVLHVGAWNEGAPSSGLDDLELVRRSRGWHGILRRSALVTRSESTWASWTSHGARPRVSLDDFGALLEQAIRSAQNHGAAVVVLVPTHPARTESATPTTRTYAEHARSVAHASGASVLDLGAALDRHAIDPEARFFDFVHPTPPAVDALARELALVLAGSLGEPRRLERAGAFELTPRTSSCFGDERLELRFAGALAPLESPVVLVGGAPLLELRCEGPARWSGLLPADAPGTYDVTVQSTGVCLVARAAHARIAPTLDLSGRILTLHSRRGDVGFLAAARALGSARWSPQGENRLDPSTVFSESFELHSGENGLASLDLGKLLARLDSPIFVQALVVPHGTRPEDHLGRASEILTLAP